MVWPMYRIRFKNKQIYYLMQMSDLNEVLDQLPKVSGVY